MIREFLESWDLFHNIYLSGWLIGLVLSLGGVLVVARNQIFVSAAISQTATLGVAIGLWGSTVLGGESGHWLGTDAALSVLAVISAVAATLVTCRVEGSARQSAEAVTGWVFLLSASASILLLAHDPHGLEEVHRLVSSSIIGATAADAWVFAGLFLLSATILAVFHRRILLFAMDPAMARATGMNLRFWSSANGVWLGVAAGLSLRVAGMLYTFGCLVLPALLAKSLARELRTMVILAPCIALAAAVLGFIAANHYDYPPAQMTVALLCLLLPLAWRFRRVEA